MHRVNACGIGMYVLRVGWEGGACASWLLRVLIYECMRTADKESDLIVLKLDLS